MVWWLVRDGGAQAWAEFSDHAGQERRMGFLGKFWAPSCARPGKICPGGSRCDNRVSEERTTASKRQFCKVITVNKFGTGEKSDLGVKQRS